MRISFNSKSPDFRGFRCHHIFLDGERIQGKVWEADEEGGFIVCHKRGPDGQILIDRERGETVKERLEGRVQIIQVEPETA